MDLGRPFTRRSALGGAAALAVAGYAGVRIAGSDADEQPSGNRDADYWRFVDRMQGLLEPEWDDTETWYAGGDTALSASVLYVHATAALRDHRGPSRNDERANRLAKRLCQHWPWYPAKDDPVLPGDTRRAGERNPVRWSDQVHEHGFSPNMAAGWSLHVVFDTAVIRGLAQAYRAREALKMDEETANLVEDRIRRCAFEPFYRYPALRLNQINWQVEVHAHAADVLDEPVLLERDAISQIRRFAAAITRPLEGNQLPNLGPGYQWHYLPEHSSRGRSNWDSPEYALIVCQALEFYGAALDAGAEELAEEHMELLTAWVQRILTGYWTHGGYFNWDSGLGFARWHQGKKHGLGAEGILALAKAPEFHPSEAYGRYAKYFLDRAFTFYDRMVDEAGGKLPPPVPFGLTETLQVPEDARLWAARLQQVAAEAIHSRLSERAAEEPPPLYAFDPDNGRLAITTPAYNTAIVATTNDAFPYGGAEIARLYDGDQRPLANVGGVGDAGFGITVRARSSGEVLQTQRPDLHGELEDPPLRLTRAPRGAVERPKAYPLPPYAGAFKAVEAERWTRNAEVAVRTVNRFRAGHIETRWTVVPRAGVNGLYAIEARFPSWGEKAKVRYATETGRRRAGSEATDLDGVRSIEVRGAEGGYDISILSAPDGLQGRLVDVEPQGSNPRPGPMLVLDLLRDAELRRTELVVRIRPVPLERR